MNIWAVSAMPVHKLDRRRDRPKAGQTKTTGPSWSPSWCSFSSDTLPRLHAHPQQVPSPLCSRPSLPELSDDVPPELCKPAIHGPPSPRSFGTLSNQLKSGTIAEAHQSGQNTSSAWSSLPCQAAAESASGEQAVENLPLSRKSSERSISASMPLWERPENVQIFGKTLFHRRGKLRRDSSANSSASSLYSAESPIDATPPSTPALTRESVVVMPDIFRRRRTRLDESAQHKLRISHPYNFQHLAHTQKSDVVDARRCGRQERETATQGVGPSVPPRRHTPPSSLAPPSAAGEGHHRVKPSLPSLPVCVPPPRPPRSPIVVPLSPKVPPRLSSRTSLCPVDMGFKPLSAQGMERAPTGNRPPLSWHGQVTEHGVPETRRPRTMGSPHVDNWPLPCSPPVSHEASLPDVPEEDDMIVMPRQARANRASIASNSSSLRGSQSVPALRHRSVWPETELCRRSSGASDTLGHTMFAAPRVSKPVLSEYCDVETTLTESWEEDIDYCYEHAVEADCDYAWERPSLDLCPFDEESLDARSSGSMSSDMMLAPEPFDVPALSPASPLSSTTAGHDATTPTAPAPSHAPFACCPDGGITTSMKPVLRLDSTALDVVEEFHLSPSLLVPGGYRQDMAPASPTLPEEKCDRRHFAHQFPSMYGSSMLNLPQQVRSSVSTSASSASGHAFERHASTTSASTDLTRLTTSTSSLDMDAFILTAAAAHETETQLPSHGHVNGMKADAKMPGRDPARLGVKDSGSIQVRRQRPRPKSLSTPPPPFGQYASLPSMVRSTPASRV